MANRIAEVDRKPLAPQSGIVAVTSGQVIAPVPTKVIVVFSVSGNLTIKMMDGNSATLNSVPTSYPIILDIQVDTLTWTGTATAVAFYHMAG